MPIAGACSTGIAASNGGGLSVTSASPIAPTGLVVTSENAMEGQVAVGGQLPLVGSVAMDGAFPSAGAGAVTYACGDGSLGISESSLSAPIPAIPTTPVIAAPVPSVPIIGPSTPTIASPAIAAPGLASPVFGPSALAPPVRGSSALSSPVLGSSFRFGPGKSPFAGAPVPGQAGLGPRGPVGRGCGFRY